MKFQCEVTINLNRDKVIELWNDIENLKHWQDGFLGAEHLSGEPGKAGSKMNMRYKIRNKEITLLETITVNNLPNEFAGTYATPEMTNSMRNVFEAIEDNQTKWTAHIHYTEINGIMMKIMAFFFSNMFKNQTQKWLDQFKVFAEQKANE